MFCRLRFLMKTCILTPWATPGVPKDAPRLPSELPQPPSVALGASRGPPGAGDAISEHPPDPKTAILRGGYVKIECQPFARRKSRKKPTCDFDKPSTQNRRSGGPGEN